MPTPAAGGGIVVGDPLGGGSNAGAAAPHGPNDPNFAAAPPIAAPVVPGAQAAAMPFGQGLREKSGDEPEPAALVPNPASNPGSIAPVPGAGIPGGAPLPGAVAGGGAIPGLPFGAPVGPNGAGPGGPGRGSLPSGKEIIDEDDSRNATLPGATALPFAGGGPNAGLPGLPGLLGGGFRNEDRDGDGAGIGAAPSGEITVKRDSAASVAASFLDLMAAGDVERAKGLIAGHAPGMLAKLRDGTLPEEDLKELQSAAAAREQVSGRAKGGRHMLYTYRANDVMILLEAEQKEEDSSVVKLELRSAPRRRR